MRKPRHLLVCDSCGCVPCECDPNAPHSPGQKQDRFDNESYNPWDQSIFGNEPSIEELLATSKAA